MTRLSVIIPGYNTPERLWRRCLESVRMACGPDDEIICVDDGSSIKPSILEEFAEKDTRVKPIFLLSNSGQSVARNNALDIASGEWVAFVDSDDEVVPGVYSKAINLVREHQADIAVFGVRAVWKGDGFYKETMPKTTDYLGILSVDELRRIMDLCLFDVVCSKIYRKSFVDVNDIRFPANICPGEDTMFALSCLMNDAKWVSLNEVGYIYYRYDGTSLSRYMPNLPETLNLWNDRWTAYLSDKGNGFRGWWPTQGYSKEWVARQQWDNIWKQGSPWTAKEKWKFLLLHKELAPMGVLIGYISKVLFSIFRKHLYLKPIRRWHQQRFLKSLGASVERL